MVRIHNPFESDIQYVQDAKPPNPNIDGVLWLRTDTYNLYSWDKTGNRWLGLETLHWDFSSGDLSGMGVGVTFAYHHEVLSHVGSLSQRSPYDFVIVSAYTGAQDTPASNDKMEIMRNAAVATSLDFDGASKFVLDTALDEEMNGVDGGAGSNRVSFRWNFGTNPPATQLMRGVVWYKLKVNGD